MTLGKRLRTSDKFIHLGVVQRGEMASAPGSSEDKSLCNVTEMILLIFSIHIRCLELINGHAFGLAVDFVCFLKTSSEVMITLCGLKTRKTAHGKRFTWNVV